jgi:hypothetical protein
MTARAPRSPKFAVLSMILTISTRTYKAQRSVPGTGSYIKYKPSHILESKCNILLSWRRLTWWFVECYQQWNQSSLLPLPPCSQSQTQKHIRVQASVAHTAVIGQMCVVIVLLKIFASSWYIYVPVNYDIHSTVQILIAVSYTIYVQCLWTF